MLKVSIRLGADRFSFAGDVSQADLKSLIDIWLNARSAVVNQKLRELTAGLTQSTDDLSDAERSDAENRKT